MEQKRVSGSGTGRKILSSVLSLFILAAATLVLAGLLPPRNPRTPAGFRQSESSYAAMRDGTRLAVRVSLPPGLEKGERVPAILESTRYGTRYKTRFILNIMLNLGLENMKKVPEASFLRAGYAFVAVDARGSGASFGRRDMELSREEIDDIGQIIDWIAGRPWSDGKVGTFGISYSGNTAELAASTLRPALKAAAPLYPDFDPMAHNAFPGGIFNQPLLEGWSESNAAMDGNGIRNIFVDGTAPVDADEGGRLLTLAVEGHGTRDLGKALGGITYFDDEIGAGYRANSLAPYNYAESIEASKVPLFVRVGWMDAGTVNGAIERFLTYGNEQALVIGPWSHAGWHFYDPFRDDDYAMRELDQAQADETLAFFDARIKGGGKGSGGGKNIRYYTFGEGKWKASTTWPIPGFETKTLYFGSDGTLSAKAPTQLFGADPYRVDFSASTGKRNRWFTNFGGGAIEYPDRAEEDRKLLTYTGAPLERDLEITGVPDATLQVASTAEDGAFFVYLEDVAPDGRVTYITEGQLRALHRATRPGALGRAVLGPRHSFERKDGKALEAGKVAEIKIAMYATSVLLRKGHRIRIAVAGHDAANFRRIPLDGNPVIELRRDAAFPSRVELPAMAR